MALKIRLKRMGKKKQPFYRVVIIEGSKPRDSRTIEDVGLYNPCKSPIELEINKERVTHWLSVGATPTDTVNRLLSSLDVSPKKERVSANLGISKKELKAKQEESK